MKAAYEDRQDAIRALAGEGFQHYQNAQALWRDARRLRPSVAANHAMEDAKLAAALSADAFAAARELRAQAEEEG